MTFHFEKQRFVELLFLLGLVSYNTYQSISMNLAIGDFLIPVSTTTL